MLKDSSSEMLILKCIYYFVGFSQRLSTPVFTNFEKNSIFAGVLDSSETVIFLHEINVWTSQGLLQEKELERSLLK